MPTPTPSVTPAAESPRVIDGVAVVPLQVSEEVELPDNVALIIETGCTQCDGPTTGFARVYRETSGRLRVDTLFTAHENTYADPGRFITSFALDSDASGIVVGLCSTPEKCAWLNGAAPDAQTTLLRSLDGGVTWSELGVLEGDHRVVGISERGVVLTGPLGAPEQRYWLFPTGEPSTPPIHDGWRIFSLPDGRFLWLVDEGRRLVFDNGQELFAAPPAPDGADVWIDSVRLDPAGQRFAVVWEWVNSPTRNPDKYFLSIVSGEGDLIEVFSAEHAIRVGGWLSPTMVVGNVDWCCPTLFDLEAGRIRSLRLPRSGRDYVQAVVYGPFARVVGTGSCVNVRVGPGVAAGVVACAADGVLLRDTGEAREVDGGAWLRVVTPAGTEGWASAEYLER